MTRLPLIALPLVAAMLVASPASAQTPLKGVMFVGGTVAEGASGYAGLIHALPGASLGRGLALRGSVGGGRYEYQAGNATIKARYESAQIALVHQSSGNWGWANISIGPSYGHTSLTPDDPGNDLRGDRWDVILQSDGALDHPGWRLGWYGAYGPANEAYQAMLQIGPKLGDGKMRLGIEGGIMGDPSYTRAVAGGFAGFAVGDSFDLQLSAGASEQAGRGPRAYVSLGLSRIF